MNHDGQPPKPTRLSASELRDNHPFRGNMTIFHLREPKATVIWIKTASETNVARNSGGLFMRREAPRAARLELVPRTPRIRRHSHSFRNTTEGDLNIA